MHEEIETKLRQLGLSLPAVAPPAGSYVPTVETGGLLFVSGQLPFENGAIAVRGRLGDGVQVEHGQYAARLCALNGLAQASAALGGLSRIVRCVKLTGYVTAVPSFTMHPQVINGASDLLLELMGERGRHARAAVGVSSLPMDAAVEVEFIFAIA